ncbi:MAG: PKD domain-containing protein [Tannerella sp.]|nr:PKD domain-containing protein [Tannerella sp.]
MMRQQSKKKWILPLTGLWMGLTLSAQQNSPRIDRVYDYRPAPGQFINVSPEYGPGDTREDILRKVEELLTGEDGGLVSLGAYGGYIVFGFDHPVVNVPDEPDFRVTGNVFVNAGGGALSESSEPGIVMVARDVNGNGLPDDAWYELAGSEYSHPQTVHSYRITYYRPDENKTPAPDAANPALTDTTYIRWIDSRGGQGYVSANSFHTQPYYPQWEDADSLVFEGARLPDNYRIESGGYLFQAFEWGYADNRPNADAHSAFNIDWAVDADGQPVHLPEIHFIKVYTAVNQYCGWLGETSTEVGGAVDLHPDAVSTAGQSPPAVARTQLVANPVGDRLLIVSPVGQTLQVIGMDGVRRMSFRVESGTVAVPCSSLPQGFHILVAQDRAIKFRKQ